MPLPAIEFALAHVAFQLRISLDSEPQTAQFSDLMMAEEHSAPFVRELGHALLIQYVATRSAQARQAPPICACGDAMTVHRVTIWSHKTLFGDVQVRGHYFYCRTCRCRRGLCTDSSAQAEKPTPRASNRPQSITSATSPAAMQARSSNDIIQD